MKISLQLNTGQKFIGKSFGKDIVEEEYGEIVFQTGMVGYPESLTDGFIKSVNDLQSSGGITHAINHSLESNGVPISYMQDYDHDTFTTNSNLGQTIFTMCKYLKDGNSN